MHQAAFEWVRLHLPGKYDSVLEVGSLDINGGVRGLLDPNATYLGIDPQAGPGVDVIADFAHYTHTKQVDLILCLEVFEHTPKWRELIASAHKNLKDTGTLIATCAAPGRAPHSARSERPIEPDEWYENITEEAMTSELQKHFGWALLDIAGTDLRLVARPLE